MKYPLMTPRLWKWLSTRLIEHRVERCSPTREVVR